MKNGDKKLKILVAPLDWGLGHATRLSAIIKELEKKNIEIIIGADNQPLAFLKKEFPHLESIKIPSQEITYSKKIHQSIHLLKFVPKFLKSIQKEHAILDNLIEKEKIDGVISDNRYGLWTKKKPCVFITHQFNIKAPFWLSWSEYLLSFLVKKLVSKFTFCWIPDCPESKLSGDLANRFSILKNTFYIGFLSRFSFQKQKNAQKKYEFAAIISGPEPQRSIFEEKVLKEFEKKNQKSIIVRGLPKEPNLLKKTKSKVELISHLPSEELQEILQNTPYLIMRSGYSSLMDLLALKRKAILVPTPKQSEQEYLAKYLKEKKAFFAMSQKDFSLDYAISQNKDYQTNIDYSSSELLENAIDKFVLMVNDKL